MPCLLVVFPGQLNRFYILWSQNKQNMEFNKQNILTHKDQVVVILQRHINVQSPWEEFRYSHSSLEKFTVTSRNGNRPWNKISMIWPHATWKNFPGYKEMECRWEKIITQNMIVTFYHKCFNSMTTRWNHSLTSHIHETRNTF